MNIFWGGFKDLVDTYFFGSSQNWTVFRVISMHGQGKEWGMFLGVANFSNIFGGASNS